jgi:trimethyllysine dioxygenase
MWAFGTFAGTDERADSAYSNVALEMHTDGAYMRDPPALQLWTCMYGAPNGGGASRYLDGLRVAERLEAEHPEAYTYFKHTPIPYHCEDDGTSLMASAPIFEHSVLHGKSMDRFRYNDYDRLTLSHLPSKQVEEFYEHHQHLARIITDPAMEYHHVLKPGMMAVVHNHRVMHGRNAFLGTRGLCGCYIGDDEFRSKLRRLAQLNKEKGHAADNTWNILLNESLDAGITPPSRI